MSLRAFGPVLMLVALTACGGNDDPPSVPPTTPLPSPPQTSVNPCVAALTADAETFDAPPPAAFDPMGKGATGLAADKRDVIDLLWRSALGARAANRAAPAADAISQDIGDLAVIEDDGTLLLPRNAFDLRNAGLRFERNSAGGFDVSSTDATFRSSSHSAIRVNSGVVAPKSATSRPSPSFAGAHTQCRWLPKSTPATFRRTTGNPSIAPLRIPPRVFP